MVEEKEINDQEKKIEVEKEKENEEKEKEGDKIVHLYKKATKQRFLGGWRNQQLIASYFTGMERLNPDCESKFPTTAISRQNTP